MMIDSAITVDAGVLQKSSREFRGKQLGWLKRLIYGCFPVNWFCFLVNVSKQSFLEYLCLVVGVSNYNKFP